MQVLVGPSNALLEHLVRPQQERLRDRQAENLRDLEVDGELDLRHDDGDRRSSPLGRKGSRYSLYYDDVNLETNQLDRQLGEPFIFSLGPSVLNDNVLALGVAEITEARPQCLQSALEAGGGGGPKKPDASNF